jgi:hypothetical protein
MNDATGGWHGEWTPGKYRQRADECLRLAGTATYQTTRSTFLRLAQTYDELAVRAQDRGASRIQRTAGQERAGQQSRAPL